MPFFRYSIPIFSARKINNNSQFFLNQFLIGRSVLQSNIVNPITDKLLMTAVALADNLNSLTRRQVI